MVKELATESNNLDATETVAVEGGGVSSETPIQESDGAVEEISEIQEATASPDELSQKYEELKRKYEKDIGAVKHVLDTRLSETQKTAEERERALKAQLDELRRKTMNEDDYKDYEKNRALERIEELQSLVEQERAEKEQIKQFNYYLKMFSQDFGLSEDEYKTDGTLEELFNSGMAAVKDKVKRTRETESTTTTNPKKEGKKPPTVAQPSSSPAAGVLSLEELAKKHAGGSVDKLYSMAERRSDLANLITEAARKKTQ